MAKPDTEKNKVVIVSARTPYSFDAKIHAEDYEELKTMFGWHFYVDHGEGITVNSPTEGAYRRGQAGGQQEIKSIMVLNILAKYGYKICAATTSPNGIYNWVLEKNKQ
ncbi:hypothetical protein HDE_04157 [Halotydeus destructor]|nr:hypothetical protein HDE_04157 [Halotydeus destructor]